MEEHCVWHEQGLRVDSCELGNEMNRALPSTAALIAAVVPLYRSGRVNYLRPRFGEVGFAALGSQAVLTDSHFYFVD